MGPLILIIILIIGGGASFAAEQAVPGNLLYPVKISINEKVYYRVVGNRERRKRP